MGEGMSMQLAKDGRRILWLAHESAPKNYTAVDVTDPASRRSSRAPTCRTTACAPIRWRRSATSWRSPIRRSRPATRPASSCSTSRRRKIRSDRVLRPLGPDLARRAPAVVRRRRIHPHGVGRGDFHPTQPNDDQFYQSIDVRNPSKPIEVGRWWLPGTQRGDNVAPPVRHTEPASTPASARTTPTSIRSGRTAATSAISTAA